MKNFAFGRHIHWITYSHPSNSQHTSSSLSEPLVLWPLILSLIHHFPPHPVTKAVLPPLVIWASKPGRCVEGFAHAQPLRADWSRSEAGPEWRHNGAPLRGVLARSLCRAGARVSDKTLVRGRAVSCCLGISGDMSGYTSDEKLRLQQLRELRRRWLKDQELSPREPVLPPRRVWPMEQFWNKFLQDGASWKNVVSDGPPTHPPWLPPRRGPRPGCWDACSL